MKTVIIGGVAGGATTAARLRRNDEHAEVIILERGEYVSYANCGLPYYIGGVIPEREQLFVQTPEKLFRNHHIDVRVRSLVTAIDRENKLVHVRNLQSGEEYTESYDKLVLSPGAEPVRPPIPGIKNEGIFTLRSVTEMDAIKEYVDETHPTRAIIVGAGFIGLEMAENLHERGILVTIVEMAQQVMNVVDYEMAAEVHQHLKTKNVEFYLRDGVAGFERRDGRLAVTLQSGRELDADMVVLSIGVRPEGKLAREAGLEIGKTGGIVVDRHMLTSDPDIYAVGDAIEFPNPITGRPAITYLAGPANKQGRIAADNIVFGNRSTYRGAIGTAVAKVFDLTVATTGASEKTLRNEGIPFKSVITHSSSHAGYYPDAQPMSIKTVYDPADGRLLGAQIVGYEGVDKRIDLFAAVIRAGGTVWDLGELEHAYAPPYSSAKDPVNIAGFVAQNTLTGRSEHIHWNSVMGCDLNEICLLDVRSPEEFELGTIEGAMNVPTYELRERLEEVPRDKTIVVFCGVGLRAYHAERVLRQNGYEDVYNLSGGYKTYQMSTEKQSNEDIFARDVIYKDDNIYQADPDAAGHGPNAHHLS
jgi:NADPH-dependent 2,4-dienoyl-CoA reductase/sulfur reductase-like enzyme/rhodanese-related sulfurtransferase